MGDVHGGLLKCVLQLAACSDKVRNLFNHLVLMRDHIQGCVLTAGAAVSFSNSCGQPMCCWASSSRACSATYRSESSRHWYSPWLLHVRI